MCISVKIVSSLLAQLVSACCCCCWCCCASETLNSSAGKVDDSFATGASFMAEHAFSVLCVCVCVKLGATLAAATLADGDS